jgi:hypothetical protein
MYRYRSMKNASQCGKNDMNYPSHMHPMEIPVQRRLLLFLKSLCPGSLPATALLKKMDVEQNGNTCERKYTLTPRSPLAAATLLSLSFVGVKESARERERERRVEQARDRQTDRQTDRESGSESEEERESVYVASVKTREGKEEEREQEREIEHCWRV